MEHTSCERPTDAVSLQVIEAIASAAGTEPVDMEPPLFDVIDPEALDRLFRPEVECQVRFEYGEYTIEVHNDGTVEIDELTHGRP